MIRQNTLRYCFVSDRIPKKTYCVWCSSKLPPTGYVSDCNTALAYCSPECWEMHERISRSFLKSYHAHKALLEDRRHEAQV